MSPVAIRGSLNLSASVWACVPLPAPCGPIKTMMSGISLSVASSSAKPPPSGSQESIVVSHDKLGLNLIHRVHCNTDYNQQAGAAKHEVHANPGRHPRS